MFPWLDRAGRLSPIKLVAFVGVLAPAAWLAWTWWMYGLGPRPVTEAIHETGDWSLRFLVGALAITPLRRIGFWPKLILIRRMLGLAALAYALAHLGLYALDQAFDWVRIAWEIVLRFYLTIGFVALLGMMALGSTSTDAAVARLGPAWHKLHWAVYPIAVLSLVHDALQSKLDVSEAVLWFGFFLFLMGFRGLHRRGVAEKLWSVPALAAASAVGTALVEAAWYSVLTGIPPWPVLEANLDFSGPFRPAVWVLIAGLAVAVVSWMRAGARRQAQRPRGRATLKPA